LKIVIDIFMGMGNCMLNARFVLLNFIILFSQIQSHDSDRPSPRQSPFHDKENRKTYPFLINPPHASRPSNKIVTNHDDEQSSDCDNQKKYKFFITSPQLEKLKKIAELSKKRSHKFLDTHSKYYQEKLDQLSDSVENFRNNISQLISIFLASQDPMLLGGELEQYQGRKRFDQRPQERQIQRFSMTSGIPMDDYPGGSSSRSSSRSGDSHDDEVILETISVTNDSSSDSESHVDMSCGEVSDEFISCEQTGIEISLDSSTDSSHEEASVVADSSSSSSSSSCSGDSHDDEVILETISVTNDSSSDSESHVDMSCGEVLDEPTSGEQVGVEISSDSSTCSPHEEASVVKNSSSSSSSSFRSNNDAYDYSARREEDDAAEAEVRRIQEEDDATAQSYDEEFWSSNSGQQNNQDTYVQTSHVVVDTKLNEERARLKKIAQVAAEEKAKVLAKEKKIENRSADEVLVDSGYEFQLSREVDSQLKEVNSLVKDIDNLDEKISKRSYWDYFFANETNLRKQMFDQYKRDKVAYNKKVEEEKEPWRLQSLREIDKEKQDLLAWNDWSSYPSRFLGHAQAYIEQTIDSEWQKEKSEVDVCKSIKESLATLVAHDDYFKDSMSFSVDMDCDKILEKNKDDYQGKNPNALYSVASESARYIAQLAIPNIVYCSDSFADRNKPVMTFEVLHQKNQELHRRMHRENSQRQLSIDNAVRAQKDLLVTVDRLKNLGYTQSIIAHMQGIVSHGYGYNDDKNAQVVSIVDINNICHVFVVPSNPRIEPYPYPMTSHERSFRRATLQAYEDADKRDQAQKAVVEKERVRTESVKAENAKKNAERSRLEAEGAVREAKEAQHRATEVKKAESVIASAGKEETKAVKQARAVISNVDNRATNKEHERSLPIGSDYYQATLTKNWVKPMNEAGSFVDNKNQTFDWDKSNNKWKVCDKHGKYVRHVDSYRMAAPAPEMPESKGCGNKSDNNKPGVFTTPAIEQQPQTLDGCGKAAGAESPMHTAHTPDPALKDTSQDLPGCGAPAKTSEEMIDETVMKASNDKTWTDKNGKVWPKGDLSGQDVRLRDDNRQHLFEDRPGHVVDTFENRERFVALAKDPTKFLTESDWGNWWYAEILPNGTQLWAEVRGEKIINCGINELPLECNKDTGLSRSKAPGNNNTKSK